MHRKETVRKYTRMITWLYLDGGSVYGFFSCFYILSKFSIFRNVFLLQWSKANKFYILKCVLRNN